MSRLFLGDLVHCPRLGDLEILHDHLLAIDNDGYIDFVGPSASSAAEDIFRSMQKTPILIPQGSFLLPTFYDLHLHAPQFLYQGTGLHLPLMQWLDEYAFKAEESLDANPGLSERVYKRLAARLVEHGTGAVLLFGTIKEETNLILARIMQETGIRAFVGKLSMDLSSSSSYVEASTDGAIASARAFAEKCAELVKHLPEYLRLVQPVLTPRFVPTCTDHLLRGLGELSEVKGLRVQSHMAESLDQVTMVSKERGAEDIDVFARSRLLTPRTVQAHCTFLTPLSLERIAALGTAVAHCPQSNAYFSATPFRLREALDLGVKVGLGSDIAGGYSIDLMHCMRQAVTISRMREGARMMEYAKSGGEETNKKLEVDWKEALYLATKGGAVALGMPLGSGMFTKDAPFDAQLIKIFDTQTVGSVGPLDFFDDPSTSDDSDWKLTVEMIEKWWCIGDASNRMGLWVQGREVVIQP